MTTKNVVLTCAECRLVARLLDAVSGAMPGRLSNYPDAPAYRVRLAILERQGLAHRLKRICAHEPEATPRKHKVEMDPESLYEFFAGLNGYADANVEAVDHPLLLRVVREIGLKVTRSRGHRGRSLTPTEVMEIYERQGTVLTNVRGDSRLARTAAQTGLSERQVQRYLARARRIQRALEDIYSP